MPRSASEYLTKTNSVVTFACNQNQNRRMTSQTTNATNIARMTADATPINSGMESANSCTAPPPAPKKKTPKREADLHVNATELKRVKKDLTAELKAATKAFSVELKATKKTLEDEIRQLKKKNSTLENENAKLVKSNAVYEKKLKALVEKRNLYTRPVRLPKKK